MNKGIQYAKGIVILYTNIKVKLRCTRKKCVSMTHSNFFKNPIVPNKTLF